MLTGDIHYVDKSGPFAHHAYDGYLKDTGHKASEQDRKELDEQRIAYKAKHYKSGRDS